MIIKKLSLNDLLGIAVWLILVAIQQAKDNIIMALSDTITQLAAEDAEIKADVEALIAQSQAEAGQITDLQAQIAALSAGAVTQDQINALQTAADDLAATHAEAVAALPAAPAA